MSPSARDEEDHRRYLQTSPSTWDEEDRRRYLQREAAEVDAVIEYEQAQRLEGLPCCTGINGSHTVKCSSVNQDVRLTCWCCLGTFPTEWTAIWGEKGSRCFACEDHTTPCRINEHRCLEEISPVDTVKPETPERVQDESLLETVDHPLHYNIGEIEHVEYVEDRGWAWGYMAGNATKYLHRAGEKPGTAALDDLKKAAWFINRLVTWVEHGTTLWNRETTTLKNLSGLRFGDLVATQPAGRNAHGQVLWRCRCDCGEATVVMGGNLVSGNTQSCGCHRKPHGQTGTPTFSSWMSMRARVTRSSYRRRGITVCEAWQDFRVFYRDMGERPSGTTLDRINNDGNYEPGNCRWATQTQQQRNRHDNPILDFDGESKPLADWADDVGILATTLKARLHAGWSVEEALITPVDPRYSYSAPKSEATRQKMSEAAKQRWDREKRG